MFIYTCHAYKYIFLSRHAYTLATQQISSLWGERGLPRARTGFAAVRSDAIYVNKAGPAGHRGAYG